MLYCDSVHDVTYQILIQNWMVCAIDGRWGQCVETLLVPEEDRPSFSTIAALFANFISPAFTCALWMANRE